MPFLTIQGFGGGAGSNSQSGAAPFEASGGIISDYSTPTAAYRAHIFNLQELLLYHHFLVLRLS